MRIISGAFRGKQINAPANLPVRPTTDFAKEALFNVLNNQFYWDEISVLDLFSGIGSISLEFLSRGCGRIVAVDNETACVKFLSETVQKMGMEEKIMIQKSDVFSFLKKNTHESFDVIFADPPYTLSIEDYVRIIDLVRENNWVENSGWFILEHSSKISLENQQNFSQSRKYGNVGFSFFEFVENEKAS